MTKILKIDRALYEVDNNTKTYKYYGRNLKWQELNPSENEKNKKLINGFTRIFPGGKQKIFHYQENKKSCCCKIGHRKQCLLHWPYPMKTESEAIHSLKGAEITSSKKCFVRHVKLGKFDKWKIFTSDEDYKSYIKTRKHKR